MMNTLKTVCTAVLMSFFIPLYSGAQSTIQGEIKDTKGKALSFVSVFLQNTTEGTLTDAAGKFLLKTNQKGNQVLVISYTGYEKLLTPIVLQDTLYNLTLKMSQISVMEEVTITAGTISANDRAVAVLKPLDIVTTAGGQGDIIGAIQTLPGVQRNGGDQTGLMVRGGDVNESLIIIDGTIAQNAFGSNVPGVSQRSRFNPFQFKGTAFSSGGYSVRYGQALSAILDLQTNDLPDKSTINIGANFAGVYFSGSKLMKDNAIEFTGSYNNLTPYFSIANTNVDFYDVPQGGGFSTRFVSKTENNGLFKINFSHSYNKTGIEIPDPATAGAHIRFGIENENTFMNTSYTYWANARLKYFAAVGYSNNTDNIAWGTIPAYRNDNRLQGRGEIWYQFGKKFNLLGGIEVQRYNYIQKYDTLTGQFSELQPAAYVEGEYKPASWFALKPGVRAEYSQLLGKGNVVPRLSFAFRTGKHGQISLASGMFYQTAATQYLLMGYKPGFQQSVHYMANYQWMKKNRTFRVEGYYKSYDQLVRENNVAYNPNQYRFNYGQVDNSGSGYAQGVDFFWRDKQSIKNFDYWISYSYVDTKRIYQNYASKVTPDYVSPHNLSIVAKYFIERMQTMFSATYSYASGRPYYNPNSPVFLADKAPDFHNISMTASYLATIKDVFCVFYLSLDNITDNHNILGYRYSGDGVSKYPVLPPIYRSIFVGVNISLTEFNKDELL